MTLISATAYLVGKGSGWMPQPTNVQLHAAEAVLNAQALPVLSVPTGLGSRMMALA